MFKKPLGTGGGESLVDGGFIEREVFDGGLVVNWASIHCFDKFHNGVTKIGIARKDSGFDGGSTAILRKKRRMEIKDTCGFEKFEDVGLDKNPKRGKNTIRVGILFFEFNDLGKVGFCAGVEN